MKRKELKLSISLIALLLISVSALGQTEKSFRINFLNPAVELELPTGNSSTFSGSIGVGYGGAYPELTFNDSGFVYIISPFIELQEKFFYNFDKRESRGKNITRNSANFVSLRFITRGPSIAENVSRTSEYDFAIGPTWGLQRSLNKNLHLLFDLGPQFYFDSEGNSGFWPIMVQINLGIDL